MNFATHSTYFDSEETLLFAYEKAASASRTSIKNISRTADTRSITPLMASICLTWNVLMCQLYQKYRATKDLRMPMSSTPTATSQIFREFRITIFLIWLHLSTNLEKYSSIDQITILCLRTSTWTRPKERRMLRRSMLKLMYWPTGHFPSTCSTRSSWPSLFKKCMKWRM